MKNKIKFKITFIFWFCLKKKPQEQFFDIYLFFLQKKHMFDININLRLIIAVTSILVFGQNLINLIIIIIIIINISQKF
jgi:hypothetical protein